MHHGVHEMSHLPSTLSLMTSHLTEDQQTALTKATTRAAALHAQAVAGRAGSDEGVAVALVADVRAALDGLLAAFPALADRHQRWLNRHVRTSRRTPVGERAVALVDHLAELAQAAAQPIPTDPGSRFAGDLDEAVVTPRRRRS